MDTLRFGNKADSFFLVEFKNELRKSKRKGYSAEW